MSTLAAVQLEDLPVVVKFILHSVSASDAYEVRALGAVYNVSHSETQHKIVIIIILSSFPLCRWCVIYVRSWNWSSAFFPLDCRPLRAAWRAEEQQCKTTQIPVPSQSQHQKMQSGLSLMNAVWSRSSSAPAPGRSQDSVTLTLDGIKSAVRFQKTLSEAWLKVRNISLDFLLCFGIYLLLNLLFVFH